MKKYQYTLQEQKSLPELVKMLGVMHNQKKHNFNSFN